MNVQHAAALLAVAAAFDNRKPDADAATAWGIALCDLRFDDCRNAIVEHYRATNDWLMPNDVIRGVKRLRQERLMQFGPLPRLPAHIDPDDTAAEIAWRRDITRRIADGEEIERDPVVAGITHDSDARKRVLELRRLADADQRTGDLDREDA